jgi:hypothetical protein
MHRNHILDIMFIPMLQPEVIIERAFVPLPSVPVRSQFPRLTAGPLRVRILEGVEEELYGKAADAADPGAECEAQGPDYDEYGDGDCVMCEFASCGGIGMGHKLEISATELAGAKLPPAPPHSLL